MLHLQVSFNDCCATGHSRFNGVLLFLVHFLAAVENKIKQAVLMAVQYLESIAEENFCL